MAETDEQKVEAQLPEVDEPELRVDVDQAEIRDTDIAFECPHCGKNLVIDYRGAGLQIACPGCGERVLVPIPDGMRLNDLDLDPGEILKQLFATRRNYQKLQVAVDSLKTRLIRLQETLGVMQEVIAEGLVES